MSHEAKKKQGPLTALLTSNTTKKFLNDLAIEIIEHFVLKSSVIFSTKANKSYSTVVLYSRDQYEIIGLLKVSYSIKQSCM